MSIDIPILRDALSEDPPDDDIGSNDITIEKMGSEALDWLLAEVRGGLLTPRQTVRALGLSSRITRQFCVERKGELLGVILDLATREETGLEVRSFGVWFAIGSVSIARGFRDARAAYGRTAEDVRALVSPVVRDGLARGLEARVAAAARAFLSPPPVDGSSPPEE